MNSFQMLHPATLQEALQDLAAAGEKAVLIAGGTDLVVKMKDDLIHPSALIDISTLREMHGIAVAGNFLQIGSATTMTEIAESPLVKEHGFCLAQGAGEVGSTQIRNRATIGGNIGNASPAADTVPCLVALGAHALIAGQEGTREVPVEDLFVGPGQTNLKPGEIITHVAFPLTKENETGFYVKLGKRKAQAISVVNVAVSLKVDQARKVFTGVRIALGSVAPTVVRAQEAETWLTGKEISQENIATAASLVEKHISPISDIRASAEYRKQVSGQLVFKAILEALERKNWI